MIYGRSPKTSDIHVALSEPLKRALRLYARNGHTTMSDAVEGAIRQMIRAYRPSAYRALTLVEIGEGDIDHLINEMDDEAHAREIQIHAMELPF